MQTIVAHRDTQADALVFAEQLIEAAIFTGAYQLALDAYPVTWQQGMKLVQSGEASIGYAMLLTCLSETPDALDSMTRALALTLRGIL